MVILRSTTVARRSRILFLHIVRIVLLHGLVDHSQTFARDPEDLKVDRSEGTA